jgi:4-hydroxybenzoate polyprenyltransferase
MYEQSSTSPAVTAPLVTRLGALAADIKLHHSVFALPWAILAAVLAAHRSGGLKPGQLILILVCMVTARTVAMLANRLLDADFDAANPRTARRAVPSGRLSKSFTFTVMILSAGVFIAAAFGFELWYHNPWPIILSPPVLMFLIGYSLMKRYTRFCHFHLGAALALAPVCAWLAIAGSLSMAPMVMFAAVLLWTAGFDILYACQDFAFDLEHGLFSIPAAIGIAPALWVARLTHACSLGCMALLAATTPELGVLFWIGIAIAGVLIVIEHSLVKPNDLSKLNVAFFTMNGVISVVVGTLGVISIMRH